MVSLPDDVMLDICVRLPVKSIGRFRCVNKIWCKLLKGRKFVQNHLCHATEINRLSVMVPKIEGSQHHIYTIDYDPPSCTSSVRVNTNLPFIVDVPRFRVLGRYNGLVCLTPYDVNIFFLWNPCTNEYKQLPEIPQGTRKPVSKPMKRPWKIMKPIYRDIQCGFGYDYKIEKFKVVILTNYGQFWSDDVDAYLHTLGSDTWVKLETFPCTYCVQPDVAQVPINGVIHWDARRKYDGAYHRIILSFNIEKEIFQEMPWPDLLSKEYRTYLCVLGGSLCICGVNNEVGFEVWEPKDCKSWVKLFSIDMMNYFGFVPLSIFPLHVKNDEFLFGFDTDVGFHVHQYGPKHGTPKPLFVYDKEMVNHKTVVYVESLVSLNSGSYVEDFL